MKLALSKEEKIQILLSLLNEEEYEGVEDAKIIVEKRLNEDDKYLAHYTLLLGLVNLKFGVGQQAILAALEELWSAKNVFAKSKLDDKSFFTKCKEYAMKLEEDLSKFSKASKWDDAYEKTQEQGNLELTLQLISDYLDHHLAERKANAEAKENEAKLTKLLELKAAKEAEGLKSMSLEELNAEIAKLTGSK